MTDVLVVGLGDIGSALLEIVKGVYDAVGYDITNPTELPEKVSVMHICFPYSERFVEQVVDYTVKVDPDLLLIESTVLPGTTLQVSEKVRAHVVHSPVRARKADGFKWGFFNYTKFIGPADKEGASLAEDYYNKSLGFKTKVCASPGETEFAKLLDLSYFGIMLGWNQEMRRIAEHHNLNFNDLADFLETNTAESGFRFPRPIYDGKPIGGHCVIQDIRLLNRRFKSKFLEAVLESNEKREKEIG